VTRVGTRLLARRIATTVLVATLLGVTLTAIYLGIVVGIGALVPVGDLGPSIAATALIALLFQPIRERARRLANRIIYGARATPYEVMAGFSNRMADSLSVDQVLPQMAEAAGRGVGATSATVTVALPHGERVETWPGAGLAGEITGSFPVRFHGEDIGEIVVKKPKDEPLSHAEEILLGDLAGQAGLALHNVRLSEELTMRLAELDEQTAALQVSRQRLVTARDAQRRGLERDIHEGPERRLREIRDRLDELGERGNRDPEALGAELDDLGARSNTTLEGLRDLARGIFPPLLADKGIVPALEAHIRKVGANARVEAPPDLAEARFDADTEACVYFCCLQAIQNVIRHAANASCAVRLSHDSPGSLSFEVCDQGPGFDVDRTARGMGLQIMQDRVDALEGELKVAAGTDGTCVNIMLPATRMATT
jgi:signal transduction histidine kinase